MNSDTFLTTAVAVIIYKRPSETKFLMEALAVVKPPKLYVIADAPKSELEQVLCDEAFEIATQPTWECEVATNRAKKNMGCRNRIASGLNWVFEHETQVIILEDDLHPSEDFFRFTEELLERYKDDPRIMHISGDNFQRGNRRTKASYVFSKHTHCSGWATWRRAWKLYEADMHTWPTNRDEGMLDAICPDPLEKDYFTKWLNWVYENQKDSWAYVWTYTVWKEGAMGINPEANLVVHRGIGESATHTKTMDVQHVDKFEKLEWPLKHPTSFVRNEIADNFTFYKRFEGDAIVAARSFMGRIRQWRNGLLRRIKK